MTPALAAAPWRCFGWSARAWSHPWGAFLREHAGWRGRSGLEIGSGVHSSLAPLMLALVQQVECSAHVADSLPMIEARNSALLPAADAKRIRYTVRDLRALRGQWDLIVMKSVLGGVYRTQEASLADVHANVGRLIDQHLTPGGLLVTLDNGRTWLEPLWARFGARRNGWRVFSRGDLPTPDAMYGFGVLGGFSAATRLGAVGRLIDDVLYVADRVLSPLTRRHAVLMHVYRKPP